MKNVSIEFWRFAFGAYMVLYHSLNHIYGIRTGGYIGVDLFFILAGFFLSVQYSKFQTKIESKEGHKGECFPMYYLANRFLRLWPMYITAFCISVILKGVRGRLSLLQMAKTVYASFPEMLMLKIEATVNGVTWYVAAMLLAGLFLAACLSVDKKQILRVAILPLAALLIYGSMMQQFGRVHVLSSVKIFGFVYDGVLRAIAGMSLGIFSYELVKRTEGIKFPGGGVLAIIGDIGLAGVLVVSCFYNFGFSDFWYIFIFFVSTTCILIAGNVGLPKAFKFEPTIMYLGGLAYPVYLLHEGVYALFRTYHWIDNAYLGSITILIVTFIEAALLGAVLKKVGARFLSKMKEEFLLT